MDKKVEEINEKNLKAKISEYETAHRAFEHFDNFRWNVGAILIAGVFVFWAFLFTATRVPSLGTYGLACTLVSLLMFCWALYGNHTYQILHYKLHRIHELEEELQMKQNLRFGKLLTPEPKYKMFGFLRSRHIDRLIYIFSSAGGPIAALFLYPLQWLMLLWLGLPIAITGIGLIYCWMHDIRFRDYLKCLEMKKNDCPNNK